MYTLSPRRLRSPLTAAARILGPRQTDAEIIAVDKGFISAAACRPPDLIVAPGEVDLALSHSAAEEEIHSTKK